MFVAVTINEWGGGVNHSFEMMIQCARIHSNPDLPRQMLIFHLHLSVPLLHRHSPIQTGSVTRAVPGNGQGC